MKVQMKMTYQCIIRLLGVQIEIVVTATMFGVNMIVLKILLTVRYWLSKMYDVFNIMLNVSYAKCFN